MKKIVIPGVILSLVSNFAWSDKVKYETFFIKTRGDTGRFYTIFINPVDNIETGYSNFGGTFIKEYPAVNLKKGDKLRVQHYRYAGNVIGLSGCKIYLNDEVVKQDTGINKSECRYTVE